LVHSLRSKQIVTQYVEKFIEHHQVGIVDFSFGYFVADHHTHSKFSPHFNRNKGKLLNLWLGVFIVAIVVEKSFNPLCRVTKEMVLTKRLCLDALLLVRRLWQIVKRVVSLVLLTAFLIVAIANT